MSTTVIIDEQELRNRIKSTALKNITREESQRAYDKWAPNYVQDLLQHGYSSHIAVCKTLCENVPKDKRNCVRVLDVGAGTGLVAKKLRDEGFTNIDALDPSESMLNQAKKDNLYNQYIVKYITGSPLDIPENSYDVITGSGIFVEEAHVPCEAIKEMIRLVKPGGTIVLICRCNLIGPGDPYEKLPPLMAKMEKDKKWTLVSRSSWTRYYMNNDAIVWCYKVL
ncbi:ubiE/COQ5 methyltransferase [Mactra antiquata]